RVVWGLREVMLIFCCRRWLSSVDLPTFGRPTMAMKPQRVSSPSNCPTLVILSCELLAVIACSANGWGRSEPQDLQCFGSGFPLCHAATAAGARRRFRQQADLAGYDENLPVFLSINGNDLI